uniref:Guanine nucleotide-binding protein alpha-2 subunit n=1 Tax=Ganoderma boninense TaxID=34458 RepID=A0A5K1K7A1_9APHY|nr:Guanine nucleotide-binding protein alpha-2 subunit [Ganoderma boninense]
MIDPLAPRAPTLPPSDHYTESQHDLIQHMLWSTARRESFHEKKREATRAKRVDNRRSKREEYRSCNSAMGRAHTPGAKTPAAAPVATAAANPIACAVGSGTATATANSATPSDLIAGPSTIAGHPSAPVLPFAAPILSGSSSTATVPPAREPSPMLEDGPEPLALVTENPAAPARDPSEDLIDFLDDELDVPLAGVKGKGKEVT